MGRVRRENLRHEEEQEKSRRKGKSKRSVTFEEDEEDGSNAVIEHYVDPLVVYLKAMINFQKFKKGTKAEIDDLLKLEKDENPNRIPYGFGISYEHPGTFILSYIRSTNPRHEFVAIHPKGFKFRKQIFKNIEQLVAYFQNHINDNVAPAKSQVRSFREAMSGGWKGNNLDQQVESIAYNDFGNGNDAGRGQGRGGRCHGRDSRGRGRGRGRDSGSRGRGFGPTSGSRDDCTDEDKGGGTFPRSNWGSGSRDPPGDSFSAGKSWEVRDSGEGNSGRRGRGRGCQGDGDQERGSWGGNNDNGWDKGQDQGKGRGRGRGSRGDDNQGNVSWGGNSHGSGMHGGGGYNDSGWGQGQDDRRGRGRRGSDQGRGRWGENNHDGDYGSGAYKDSGSGGSQDEGRGRGRGSPGNSQGGGRWCGNNSNEERNRDEDSRGKGWGLGNAGSGNENVGWSAAYKKNASSSGGWGGIGGKSW